MYIGSHTLLQVLGPQQTRRVLSLRRDSQKSVHLAVDMEFKSLVSLCLEV